MWRNILGVALYQIIVMLVLLYVGPIMFEGMNYEYYGDAIFFVPNAAHDGGISTPRTYHYTFMFFTFMVMQLFNSINSRKLGLKQFNVFEGFFNNFWFLVILAGEFAATWLMTVLANTIFRTTPLNIFVLLSSIGFGVGCLLVGLALKAVKQEHVDKIPELINENANDKDDYFAQMQKKMNGKGQKDQLERLLDSN
jgi:Ca2+ transporting ATPase